MINPAWDVWAWAAAVVFLVLMAARAWAVETSQSRLGRGSTSVRALTGAVAGSLAILVVLLALQGGTLLVSSIVNHQELTPAGGPAPAAPAAAVPGR